MFQRSLLLFPIFAFSALSASANTAIETETAQMGKSGDITVSQSVEFEKADDGKAGGTLTQIEYAITDRAEILIEPFFRRWEQPEGEDRVSGRGDLEITPSYMVVKEHDAVPAVIVAMKLKVPTGSEEVGGSKKYDYYPYIILGQHYAGWIFNANIGVNYANMGNKTDNPIQHNSSFEKSIVWDIEAETELAPQLSSYVEVFRAEDKVKTVSMALEYQFAKHVSAFAALGYTEDHAIIFRPGVNFQF
jgi:hypothetical protein